MDMQANDKKSRILITGSKGFIATNMISYLREVFLVDGFEWGENYPDLRKYDLVIHLGAIADMTEMDVDKVMEQNLEFSKDLFRDCSFVGVPLQYASSSSVYGNTDQFSEDSPVAPQTPYAWSKYLFDRWVFKQPHSMKVQGFRYFNVFGHQMGLRQKRASAIHKWFKQAKEEGQISVWEDADQIFRDWTCVDDVCKIHHRFMLYTKSGIWNVGPGNPYSFLEIAQAIADQTGAKIHRHKMPKEEQTRFRQTTAADIKSLNYAIGKQSWTDVIDWIKNSDYASQI